MSAIGGHFLRAAIATWASWRRQSLVVLASEVPPILLLGVLNDIPKFRH